MTRLAVVSQVHGLGGCGEVLSWRLLLETRFGLDRCRTSGLRGGVAARR